MALSQVEYIILATLARLADDAKLWYAFHPVSTLLEHVVSLSGRCRVKGICEKKEEDVLTSLLAIRRETVNHAYDFLTIRYRSEFGDSILRDTLLAILARFYLRYDRKAGTGRFKAAR